MTPEERRQERIRTHVLRHHKGHLTSTFEKAEDVTWHQLHHLLHRLMKWKDWRHT